MVALFQVIGPVLPLILLPSSVLAMSKPVGEAFQSNVFNKILGHTAKKKGPAQPRKANKPSKAMGRTSQASSSKQAGATASKDAPIASKTKKSIARPVRRLLEP